MALMNRRHLLMTGAAALLAPSAVAAAEGYQIPKHMQARIVRIRDGFAPGEIHVDPGQFALYWTLDGGKAIRYPVGIGKEGRYYSGTFRVGRKAEWPRWTPTKNMIRREPHIYAKHAAGMPGGGPNPLGARALYLYNGGRDSLLRIHGTPQPENVGRAVSNGCVRMINAHVIDLANRVPNGTRVVLH
ncbi:hypothetical protein BOO69_16500 [Sulfitobacter alexandrii]|uniref:L,D-TPase catalytic domain-containing protein n=1 Tax=Sulfitobacter alexandrii TaxID=1917485 RepID=A0A1J0WKH7_9RHOB|nr:L,D-transpeptidase [Sulfitobacter alexandrii]APE44820.1 hypothetical protein BOO69_16500 [Sulfitobacter alexandrii]